MAKRMDRPERERLSPWLLAVALGLAMVSSSSAIAQEPPPPGSGVEKALADAEAQLAAGEPQISESVIRGALLEAWHLLGLLAVADGDLPAARDALERSTVQAAVGILSPRIDLALVLHQLGEVAGAQQRLRALTRQFRSEPRVWQVLVDTLIADGRLEEVEEQLEDLRLVLPEVADGLRDELAGLEDSAQAQEARRPRVDLSRLGSVSQDPESSEARERLGSTLTRMIARAQEALESIAGARASAPDRLEDLLGSLPESLNQVVQAVEQGQVRDAAGLLRRAQKQGHESPEASGLLSLVQGAGGNSVRARLELARVAGRRGASKAALALLSEARQRAPSSEEVLATQARVAVRVGLNDVALRALEPLVGIFPRVAEYPYLLGVARGRLGLTTEAVEAFQQSVELAPREPEYRFALAEALNVEKRFDEAEEHLVRVLETSPEDLAAIAALAQAEEGQDKLESAEQHARDVLAKAPEHSAAHLVIGMVRMKQERYAEARVALESALAGDPGDAKTHYQLSLACMRLGDREAAKHHLDLYRAAQAGDEGQESQLTLESGTPPAGGNPR